MVFFIYVCPKPTVGSCEASRANTSFRRPLNARIELHVHPRPALDDFPARVIRSHFLQNVFIFAKKIPRVENLYRSGEHRTFRYVRATRRPYYLTTFELQQSTDNAEKVIGYERPVFTG